MKKILLATAIAAVISASSAFADTKEDTFYLKINGNWVKMAKTKGLKSKNDATIGIGAGYYVMDNARFDLTFDHYFNPMHKGKLSRDIPEVPAVGFVPKIDARTVNDNAKLKSSINTLMINGYMDLGNLDAIKFFVGAGFGISQIKGKLTRASTETIVYADASALTGRKTVLPGDSHSFNSKKKYNFAYAGYVGTAYELSPGITGELAYSYKHLGKTKAKQYMPSATYNGHHVGAGIRFDM